MFNRAKVVCQVGNYVADVVTIPNVPGLVVKGPDGVFWGFPLSDADATEWKRIIERPSKFKAFAHALVEMRHTSAMRQQIMTQGSNCLVFYNTMKDKEEILSGQDLMDLSEVIADHFKRPEQEKNLFNEALQKVVDHLSELKYQHRRDLDAAMATNRFFTAAGCNLRMKIMENLIKTVRGMMK